MDAIRSEHHHWTYCEDVRCCIPPSQFSPFNAREPSHAVNYPVWSDDQSKWIAYAPSDAQRIQRHFSVSADPLTLKIAVRNAQGHPIGATVDVTVQRDASSFAGHQYWRGIQIIPGRSVRWMRLFDRYRPAARPQAVVPVVSSTTNSSTVVTAASTVTTASCATNMTTLTCAGVRRPRDDESSTLCRSGEDTEVSSSMRDSKRVRLMPPSHNSESRESESEQRTAAVVVQLSDGINVSDDNNDDDATKSIRNRLPCTSHELCECGELQAETCYVCQYEVTRTQFRTPLLAVAQSRDRPVVEAIRLPCGHAVHVECIEYGFVKHNMFCGLCRTSVDAHPKVRRLNDDETEPISFCTRCNKPRPLEQQCQYLFGCSHESFLKWTKNFVDLGSQPDGELFVSLEPGTLPGTGRCAELSSDNTPIGTTDMTGTIGTATIPLHRQIGRDIGTFVLMFTFPSFRADATTYPEYKGEWITGTRRCYFVPGCRRGIDQLNRLVRAFIQRKVFRVGYPLSRVVSGPTVVHGSLPFRSCRLSTPQNPHGFPDANYLLRLSIALDDLLHTPANETEVVPAPTMQLQISI